LDKDERDEKNKRQNDQISGNDRTGIRILRFFKRKYDHIRPHVWKFLDDRKSSVGAKVNLCSKFHFKNSKFYNNFHSYL
jgi:hypothetical protein